jgi:integrase
VRWPDAVRAAGLSPDVHFHDLRHTGNDLAAAAGATTRELMRWMGHSSVRAALIYQHGRDERDREIAENIDERLGRREGEDDGDGTAGPPVPAA